VIHIKVAATVLSSIAIALTIAACGGNEKETTESAKTPSTAASGAPAPSPERINESTPRDLPPTTAPSTFRPSLQFPDVRGQDAETAKNNLESMGFKDVVLQSVDLKDKGVAKGPGWVVSNTNYVQGSMVNPGAPVVLFVIKKKQ
jgi:hypothetical protein